MDVVGRVSRKMFSEELAFANVLADRAAEIAMGFFGGEFEVRQKPDFTPVTEADTSVEAMIREELAKQFPGDAILGEEGGLEGEGDRVWIVDPVDGTKNFADGIPLWGTLIAFTVDGHPVAGVASAPAIGERYAGAKDEGATCNGRSVHVSTRAKMSEALVMYGGLESWLNSPTQQAFATMVADARRTRGFGDFWGHMLVARGAADVMFERELRSWDTAALQIIVEEAGGTMTTMNGDPISDRSSVLTTNGGPLHDDMIARFGGTP
jgi:histidinol-phosphatase